MYLRPSTPYYQSAKNHAFVTLPVKQVTYLRLLARYYQLAKNHAFVTLPVKQVMYWSNTTYTYQPLPSVGQEPCLCDLASQASHVTVPVQHVLTPTNPTYCAFVTFREGVHITQIFSD